MALARLGLRVGRSLEHVQQLTETDCGAACLATVLRYHGKPRPLDELRAAMGTGRDGVNALGVLRVAQRYGLRGRGVRVGLKHLDSLTPGAILHWEFRHFVVFESVDRRGVTIIDPGLGRRRVTLKRFDEAFTGIALLLEPGEDFERGEAPRSPTWAYLREISSHRELWAHALSMSALIQLLGLALPLATAAFVDRVIPRANYDLFAILGLGVALMVVFQVLAAIVRGNLLVQLRCLLDAKLTVSFFDHLVALPYAFFQRRSTGDLVMRLNSNAVVREILTSGAMSAALDGALVTIYLVLIAWISPLMAAVVVGLAAVQFSLYFATRRAQEELMTEGLALQAKTSSYEVEILGGIETLKSMGAEDQAVERWTNLFVDTLNTSLRRGRLDSLVEALLGGFRMAAPLSVLAVGAELVLRGQLSLGEMLGLSALCAGFLVPLAALVGVTLRFQALGSYLERIEDVMRTEREQDLRAVVPAKPLGGAIKAEGVGFRYEQNGPLIVREVDVEIAAGQVVAIVGASGAGKSTLAKLLLGLYQPEHGRVLYDGVDLARLELRSVRRQLGVVTQGADVFGTSVRENIALGHPGVGLGAVEKAAKLAEIHADIAALPMGYDTLLADGGASMSGGQRQRLALARALVGDPAILLLDEATSSLDRVTEAAIERSLAKLECTRIIIAHRLSTIVGADLILVMHEGRVVEAGTHTQLLAAGGRYAGLYAGSTDATAEP
ncbi:peptidase domain-containing ABC transporter [Enhygromyxa salina]|uniref:Toxin RTX-I translocation ATP-binding protein n=1 Tax=Enhygromyxa salina TaxID=215803 RepID=A0A2S9YPG4_9BACT|nr:peptidase domain-containing ABC transporter [Enhygromyxa salina]PRQ06949.1 Toxin RTX-I translocation ATP-binding protein [Enhygromyxa salina]